MTDTSPRDAQFVDDDTFDLVVVTDGQVRRWRTLCVFIWSAIATAGLVGLILEQVSDSEVARDLSSFLNLGTEQAPGTWVTAMMHLTCAVLAAFGAVTCGRLDRRWRKSWWLLAAVFAFLSFDEVAGLHERFTNTLDGAVDVGGPVVFVWVIPVTVLGLWFLWLEIPFLRSLGRTGRDLVIAGMVFVIGALGIDEVSGALLDSPGDADTIAYATAVLTEELLELAAVMFASVALMRYFVRVLENPVVSARAGGPSPSTDG